MFEHFVRSLASESKATIHIRVSGRDPHHMIEAAHKALGLALRKADDHEMNQPDNRGVIPLAPRDLHHAEKILAWSF